MNAKRLFGPLAFALLLAACAGPRPLPPSADLDELAFRRHVQTLASDEFEGRKPGTPGEQKTIAYIEAQFKALGLKPGNGKSYQQPVPLIEITAAPDALLSVSGRGAPARFAYGDDVVLWTKRAEPKVQIANSDLVFVGYGIVAPEYQWDDYAGLDVHGKTVVVLVNDPGFGSGDPALFKGRTMTYYGRWTYKFEEAARHGAAAVLVVHSADAAGYGWNVIKSSWIGPQLDRVAADGEDHRASIEGWISAAAAQRLFAQAGMNFEQLKPAAARRGFKAVPMGLQAAAALQNTIRYSTSANLIAVLPGAKHGDEYVVYTAHWDHFGKTTAGGATQIFHGAIDNASGVAGVLTLAQSFSRAAARPARSIVFLCVTGEESGLLGSRYFVEHPLFALKDTIGVINLDAMHIGGPTRDVAVIGYGNSELEDILRVAAGQQGRELRPDPEPEKGHYFRSDHFSFAKAGVPSLFVRAGIDDTEHGPDWGQRQLDDYTAHRYHQPGDEYSPAWDLRGTMQDLHLLLDVGERLAQARRFPNWYPSSEFRAIRDRSRPPSRTPPPTPPTP